MRFATFKSVVSPTGWKLCLFTKDSSVCKILRRFRERNYLNALRKTVQCLQLKMSPKN